MSEEILGNPGFWIGMGITVCALIMAIYFAIIPSYSLSNYNDDEDDNYEDELEFIKKYKFSEGTIQTFSKYNKDVNIKSTEFKDIQKALKDYYKIILLNDGDGLVGMPVKNVDDLWHAHILSTKEYEDFCEEVYGTLLHHYPFVAKKKKDEKIEEASDDNLINFLNTGDYPHLAKLVGKVDKKTLKKNRISSNDGMILMGGLYVDSATATGAFAESSSDSSDSGSSSSSSCGGGSSSSCGGGC